MCIDYCTYLGFSLLAAPREHVLHGLFPGIYWLWLCPHFGAPKLEARLLWWRLFIVLMIAAHISPNVFSLQLSLLTYTKHLIIIHGNARIHIIHHSHTNLYYTTLYYTAHSCPSSHLHFFCSSWQAGCSRLIVSDTLCFFSKFRGNYSFSAIQIGVQFLT